MAVHAAAFGAERQLVVGDTMTAVTLLLLAMLKNSERRAEHAVRRKLDAIAEALPELQEDEPGEAPDRLREAVGVAERLYAGPALPGCLAGPATDVPTRPTRRRHDPTVCPRRTSQ
ncbi:hypothetical protein [Kitasatospora sp. NPDC007106]|uniref:hypothetical protein n=1 Tax=Kitasatospora sp. NPDC007106 TaxID=3156914 RepID=UPI0033DA9E91